MAFVTVKHESSQKYHCAICYFNRINSARNTGNYFYPKHGDTAFTVPLFDEFMKRTRL